MKFYKGKYHSSSRGTFYEYYYIGSSGKFYWYCEDRWLHNAGETWEDVLRDWSKDCMMHEVSPLEVVVMVGCLPDIYYQEVV